MSIGLFELLFIAGLALCVLLAVMIVLALTYSQSRARATWVPGGPPPSGPPSQIARIDPESPPLSEDAAWQGEQLHIKVHARGVVPLFTVPLASLERCVLVWRFEVAVDSLAGPSFGEMWCHIAGMGKYFSRGVDQPFDAPMAWRAVEIPFHLASGQRCERVDLNLVLGSPGEVRVRNLELLTATFT